MKFFSFIFIFSVIILTISIKLVIANQETKIKRFNNEVTRIENLIEKMKTDISYSTRPQELERINEKEFGFLPILQSDVIKLEE